MSWINSKGRGETEEALNHFQKAVGLKSDFAEAECELAIMLQQKGELESSRNHFLNSLEINPNYANAYFHYGLLLIELEDIEEVKNNFDKVTRNKARTILLLTTIRLSF